MPLLTVRTENGVAVVTLDDPGRRNAISTAMAVELVQAIATIETSQQARAMILTGRPPAFSAGADLADLENATRDSLRRIYEGFLAVARCPLPTIAAVNGPAVGAGFNLALACDLRLASPAARFESRFMDLALHPGGGHTWGLHRLLGPQGAAAMTLFGAALDGREAARRGLAWACVAEDELVAEARQLASRAAAAPGEYLRQLKSTLTSIGAVACHADAVEAELEPQYRSLQRPAFRQRLEAVKRRIAGAHRRE